MYRTVAVSLCESLHPQFLSCFCVPHECDVLRGDGTLMSAKEFFQANVHPSVNPMTMAQSATKGISVRNQELHDQEANAPSSVADVLACLSGMLNPQTKASINARRFSILVDEATANGAHTISECFPEMDTFFKQHSLGESYPSLESFHLGQTLLLNNARSYDADRCILLGDSQQLDANKSIVKVEPTVCFVLPPGTELPHPFQYVPDNLPPGHLTIAPCLGPTGDLVCSIAPLKRHLHASALETLRPWKVHCLQLKAAALPPELRAPFDPDTHRLACLMFEYFEDLCAEQEGARASDWLVFVLAAEYPPLREDRTACFSARGNAELLSIIGGVIKSYDDDDAVAAAREVAGMAQRLCIIFDPGMAASAPTTEK